MWAFRHVHSPHDSGGCNAVFRGKHVEPCSLMRRTKKTSSVTSINGTAVAAQFPIFCEIFPLLITAASFIAASFIAAAGPSTNVD